MTPNNPKRGPKPGFKMSNSWKEHIRESKLKYKPTKEHIDNARLGLITDKNLVTLCLPCHGSIEYFTRLQYEKEVNYAKTEVGTSITEGLESVAGGRA